MNGDAVLVFLVRRQTSFSADAFLSIWMTRRNQKSAERGTEAFHLPPGSNKWKNTAET